jgi:hypothetical protein
VFSQSNDKVYNFAEIHLESYINDTLCFTVKNITSDTIYVSFYLQALTDQNIITTSCYDIFCNPANPSTLITRILPEKSIYIKTAIQEVECLENNEIPYGIEYIEIKHRLLLRKGTKNEIFNIPKIYSNWVCRK